MKYINLTPHAITLNNGTTFEPSGKVARVSTRFTAISDDLLCHVEYGEVENLPAPEEGTMYIVSAMVKAATKRTDVVAPATGHPLCVRNEKGQIVSVPCFVQ